MDTGPAIPDIATIDVPVGRRVMIAGDLLLAPVATPASISASGDLARAVDGWTGPGLIVFNGNLFDLVSSPHDGSGRPPTEPALASTLEAHRALITALDRFAAQPGREVLIMPGARDSRLAWDDGSARLLRSRIAGVEFALAADLHLAQAGETKVVHVEPGHGLDASSAFVDPRNPLDTPLGYHLVAEVLPGLGRTKGNWLSGMDRLVDRSAMARFVASRLTYRRALRHIWWLGIPVAIALVLKFPLAYWLRLKGHHIDFSSTWLDRLGLVGATTGVDLVLFAGIVSLVSRRTWNALRASTLGRSDSTGNGPARQLARRMINAGCAGVVTSHTFQPELTHLGPGFYANTGAGAEVVEERSGRLGLPPVFVAYRQLSWVELEAGADLHVRLLQARIDLPGANLAERLAARGPRRSDAHPQVVASFPQGQSWPMSSDPVLGKRRVRRWSAAIIALAGLANFLSAVTPPLEHRLRFILHLVPLGVSETADALVALASLGLAGLARGIRRGQRQAWAICIGLLVGTAILNLVKAIDVEETVVSCLAIVFLLVNRKAFDAAVDRPSQRRGLAYLVGGATAVTLITTGALELSLALSRHHHALSFPVALQAVAERLVGLGTVTLPHRVNEFLSPALAAIGLGLAAFILVLGFRPVVGHRTARRRPTSAIPGPSTSLGPTAKPASSDWDRARSVVARWGRGTLDYFALRSDKQYFFDHESLVSFAVYGGVCLVSPDPIGPEAERDQVWSRFRSFADRQGWSVGLIGAGEEWLPIYRSSGMHDLYVGDEAVVDVANFTLEGGRNKGLRQAVNRIAKYGYTISFCDPAHVDSNLGDELRRVMTKSRQGDVERGFSMTLGRVLDPADRGLLLALARDPENKPVAFCQYVPAPGVNGYSLDLMRRDEGDHPNGLIDFVVVETIRHLKDRHMGGLGLNFATMRAVVAGESGDNVTQRAERWLLRKLSGSMQIESLWKFNAKYDPAWLPRYAVYDSPEHMVAIAVAIARAESFWEIPIIGRFLVPADVRNAV
ncbi:MAG: bifunctional lysylphosphatidylglycerol flippase/synthetase MprF [Acidimicrobiales bacterium]